MSVEITFSAPCPLMSMNDREHWRRKAAHTKYWREMACLGAMALGAPSARAQPPSIVHVQLPVKDQRRRDPHNYYPTVKAIVDGLVDAGLWSDDTPEFVTTVEPELVVSRTKTVTVTLTPRTTP